MAEEVDRVSNMKVELDLQSMSINWTPTRSTFSFSAKWVCTVAGPTVSFSSGRAAHGDLTLDLYCKGNKPKQVRLKGIVGEEFTNEERSRMALEIKKQLREQVRYMADQAYRALHTQSLGNW